MDKCPKCHAEIDAERMRDPVVVCQECGAMVNDSEKKEEKAQFWSFFWTLSVICGVILIAFFYFRAWPGKATTVLPIQLKSMFGLADIEDYETLASACEDLVKIDCVADATKEIQMQQPGHLVSLFRLGHTKYLTKSYADAVEAYQTYFVHGGRDTTALYEYAGSLAETDDLEKARSIYEIALKQKPDVLQITVYEKYVRLLMTMGDQKEAIKTIRFVQSKATRSTDFMDKELKTLLKK